MYDITGAVSLWDHLAETSKPIIIYGIIGFEVSAR